MSPVTTTHIGLDERGVGWIDDTNIKVIEVAMESRASGASPEEIEYQHWGTLSLAQIHAALAFYHDHEQELNEEIDRQAGEYEQLRSQAMDSPLRRRLRSQGKLR